MRVVYRTGGRTSYIDTWDSILHFRCQQDSDNYVNRILRDATDEEKRRIKLAFLGDLAKDCYDSVPNIDAKESNRDVEGYEPIAQGSALGGGDDEEADQKKISEYKLYNLLELADSIHDCSNIRTKHKFAIARWNDEVNNSETVKNRRNYIYNCVGSPIFPKVKIPVGIQEKDFKNMKQEVIDNFTPKNILMRMEDVASWDTFLKYMTLNPSLDFDGDYVNNTMFCKNFMSGMYNFKSGDFETEYRKYLMNCIKVYTEDTVEDQPNYTVLRKTNHARCVGGSVYADILKSQFPDTPDPYEIGDSLDESQRELSVYKIGRGHCMNVEVWSSQDEETSKELIKLTQLADLCRNMRIMFGKDAKFMLDTEPMIVCMVMGIEFVYKTFADNFIIDKDDAVSLLPKNELISSLYPDRDVELTDQQLTEEAYEAYINSVNVNWSRWYCDATLMDARNPDMDKGIQFSPVETGPVFHEKSHVKITLRDASPTRYTYDITSELSEIKDSTRTVEKINGSWEYPNGDTPDHSADGVIFAIDAAIKYNDSTNDCADKLAIKRAGDWGMIRHCKKNNMVFVTQDRFCALYAAYLDVEVLFLSTKEHENVNQYSFALLKKTSITKMQEGSGKSKMGRFLWLTAITVAMAVLQSFK